MNWLRKLSAHQRTILAIAWVGWVFDIMDTGLFNFAKGPMLTQILGVEGYHRQGAQIEGQIQAVFLLGWALGGLGFGVLADRWGRQRTLTTTVLVYCLFTGLTALCHTVLQVEGARFLTALGVGGEWAAGAALVAESFADHDRPKAAAILQSAAAAGPVLAALANLALAGRAWQYLFLIGIVPALLAFSFRARQPSDPSHDAASKEPSNVSPLVELWRNRVLRKTTLAAILIGAVGVTGAATATYWQPNLVISLSQGLPKFEIDTRKSTVAMVSHIGTLLGVFAAPYLCQRFGRKRTIAAFFAASPFAVMLALAGGASYGRLLVLSPLVNFFSIGVSGAFVLYFPELFPSRMRATGAGLAYNVGRALSIPFPIVTGAIIGMYGGSVVAGVLLSGSVYLIGLIAIPLAPETRGMSLPT